MQQLKHRIADLAGGLKSCTFSCSLFWSRFWKTSQVLKTSAQRVRKRTHNSIAAQPVAYDKNVCGPAHAIWI